MGWELPSTEVALPSADLLQSAYESVRPHLRPEDVPAALTKDVGPGVCVSSAERLPLVPSTNAFSDPCTTSYSPCSKMDERSTLTSDEGGAGGCGGEAGLATQQALYGTQGKSPEQQKRDTTQKKKQSRLGGVRLRTTSVDIEHRHERVIQHRDRSTTYTLGGPRCSRTDGKHWQCKREALPDEKYCEKHLHRGLLRSRKRKRGDNFQDLEGERLFQGWQKAKPKVQLWPGLCQPPPQMDQSPASSQSGLPSQALFPTPSLQVPPSDDSPWLAAGPQAALGQWTPAQEQILKATLSELGLDENNALLASGSAIAELRAQSRQLEVEGSPWAELPYDATGPPRPLLPDPKTPNVLRVGQDQAVLPPSAQCAPDGDGSFTLAISLATLASVGVGANADGLISTWGCRVPIYIVFGGTSEVVKLEALRKDGDSVVFKGRARAGLELGGRGSSSNLTDFEGPACKSAAIGKRGAVIPWDGDALAEDPAFEKAAKGLNLDLNLHAAAVETGRSAAPQSESPIWKAPGPSFHEKPPLSPSKRNTNLRCSAQESSGHFLQTLDARPVQNELGANPGLGLLHRLGWESAGEGRGRGAPPVSANKGSAGLRRTVSLSKDKPDHGIPLQRIASLPVGFGLAPSPPKASQTHLGKLKAGPGIGAEGSVALGGLNLGGLRDVLVGNVASVILQTPRGVFLGGGGKLDEMETEGSCDEKWANQEKPRVLSDGQGSQSGTGGDSMDSASSLLRSRKRAREGVRQGVGFSMGGFTLELTNSGQGREKGRRTNLGERAVSTSRLISELDGPAMDFRAPANGAGFAVSGPGSGDAGERCQLWYGSETMQLFPVAKHAQSKDPIPVSEEDGRPSIGGQQEVAKGLTGGSDKRAGLQGLSGPYAGARLFPAASSGLEQPFSLWKGEGARTLFEAARGSELTAQDLIGPIKSIPRSVWGPPERGSRVL